MNLSFPKKETPSKYSITAIDNDGIEKSLSPSDWQKITHVGRGTILSRYKREMRARKEGGIPINMRCIVGLEPYPGRRMKDCVERKANPKPVDPCAERSLFLYGK